LRRIAATIGVTYEDLTGDYSQVNFSSARMARMAHWANVHDWRWNMLIPQLCRGVWGWAMELSAGLEGWTETPGAEWSPPPMPMLEPDKEGLAYSRLVRSGAMTLYQAIRERGEDPASHLAEIAEGNAKLDELGIWLDSDPRRTSAAGLTQARPGGGNDEGT
jgi:capsid protein